MESIEVSVNIHQQVTVDIEIYDVLSAINDLPITKRWSYLGTIMNQLKLDLSDLTEDQKEIVKKFLEANLLLFNPPTQLKSQQL